MTNHACDKAAERYGIDINFADCDAIIKDAVDGKLETVADMVGQGFCYAAQIRGRSVYPVIVLYESFEVRDGVRGTITTFLSSTQAAKLRAADELRNDKKKRVGKQNRHRSGRRREENRRSNSNHQY